ncbi:MAG TPA: hypothetical protein PKA88_28835, partial [Polyangiaceae bacterium]|nr:hypothetical protein [Polyangiaceae bacterium]
SGGTGGVSSGGTSGGGAAGSGGASTGGSGGASTGGSAGSGGVTGTGGGGSCVGIPAVNSSCNVAFCYCSSTDNCFPKALAQLCCAVAPSCK